MRQRTGSIILAALVMLLTCLCGGCWLWNTVGGTF